MRVLGFFLGFRCVGFRALGFYGLWLQGLGNRVFDGFLMVSGLRVVGFEGLRASKFRLL